MTAGGPLAVKMHFFRLMGGLVMTGQLPSSMKANFNILVATDFQSGRRRRNSALEKKVFSDQ